MVALSKLTKYVACTNLVVGSQAADLTSWTKFRNSIAIPWFTPGIKTDAVSHVAIDDEMFAGALRTLSRHPTTPGEVQTECLFTPNELTNKDQDVCGAYINRIMEIYGLTAEKLIQALLDKRVDPENVKLRGRVALVWRGGAFPEFIFNTSHPDAKRAQEDVRNIESRYSRQTEADALPTPAELASEREQCKHTIEDITMELELERGAQNLRLENCESRLEHLKANLHEQSKSAYWEGSFTTLLAAFFFFLLWKTICFLRWIRGAL